jgi:hypothetical protein
MIAQLMEAKRHIPYNNVQFQELPISHKLQFQTLGLWEPLHTKYCANYYKVVTNLVEMLQCIG